MTAYELRRHLAAEHDVRLAGADYGTLVTVHDIEHRAGAEHTHDDDQAGHAIPDAIYTALLVLLILGGLYALGVKL